MQNNNHLWWVIIGLFALLGTVACKSQSSFDETAVSSPVPPIGRELADTVILYTTIAQAVNLTGSTESAPNLDYWALKTWPHLPAFDHPVFDLFYGEAAAMQGIAHYLANYRPQISPDGRYLALPGIGAHPSGDLGTGFWLVDLQTGVTRQILSQASVVTWAPDSETISYVDSNTLYTLTIDEKAIPEPLFTHTNLSGLYAHWSPDGQWIAVVVMRYAEVDQKGGPELINTYWLVPANGEPAQQLASKQDFAMEYTTGEMAWSPDGQFLLMRNEIFNLQGARVGTAFPGKAHWLPDRTLLLVNGNDGLRLMTVTAEEIAVINAGYATALAFSRDSKQLAYTQPAGENEMGIFTYHFDTGENRYIAELPASSLFPLRWSAHDSHLIAGAGIEDRAFIWTLDAMSNDSAEPLLLLEDAILIEVVAITESVD